MEIKGLSQRALAKQAGVAYKTIQLIEKGEDVRMKYYPKNQVPAKTQFFPSNSTFDFKRIFPYLVPGGVL